MIIVNGFQPLTIITKCSILDVAAALDLPLGGLTIAYSCINIGLALWGLESNSPPPFRKICFQNPNLIRVYSLYTQYVRLQFL